MFKAGKELKGAPSPFFIVMKILGFWTQKKQMMQAFDKEGLVVPITVLFAPPSYVTGIYPQLKQVQVVSSGAEKRKLNKALAGILRKAGLKHNWFRFKNLPASELPQKIGEEVKLSDVFQPGQLVKVRSISKGRGFAGVIKRWGFHSQPKTHGQSDRERAPGSIGAQTPGRVIKGKKMPGHYGHQQITVDNLLVVKTNAENNEVWIRGAIPGHYNSWVYLEVTGRKQEFAPLAEAGEDDNGGKKEN